MDFSGRGDVSRLRQVNLGHDESSLSSLPQSRVRDAEIEQIPKLWGVKRGQLARAESVAFCHLYRIEKCPRAEVRQPPGKERSRDLCRNWMLNQPLYFGDWNLLTADGIMDHGLVLFKSEAALVFQNLSKGSNPCK
jgi:hypothetical protein